MATLHDTRWLEETDEVQYLRRAFRPGRLFDRFEADSVLRLPNNDIDCLLRGLRRHGVLVFDGLSRYFFRIPEFQR